MKLKHLLILSLFPLLFSCSQDDDETLTNENPEIEDVDQTEDDIVIEEYYFLDKTETTDEQGNILSQYTNTYNDNKQIIKTTLETMSAISGNLFVSQYTDYTYSENGNLSQEEVYYYIEGVNDPNFIHTITTEYNSQNLASKKITVSNGSMLRISEFEYNNENKLVKVIYIDQNNEITATSDIGYEDGIFVSVISDNNTSFEILDYEDIKRPENNITLYNLPNNRGFVFYNPMIIRRAIQDKHTSNSYVYNPETTSTDVYTKTVIKEYTSYDYNDIGLNTSYTYTERSFTEGVDDEESVVTKTVKSYYTLDTE